jgi:hypothetical protein
MPVEVQSPVSRKGSRVGSITRGESPGARSGPGRGDQSDEPPEQQSPATHVHVHQEAGPPEQQEPEERSDSGALRRLADRLLGRRPRAVARDSFRNFPRG